MTQPEPTLGQLIWLVRRELEWAHQTDADHPLRFDVGTVELDVTVEVTRTTSGSGGLNLMVMGIGGKGELSREGGRTAGSTVHVTLTPVDNRTGGARYQVSGLDTEPPPRHEVPTAARLATTADTEA